ncbi:glucose-1-phosphate thymidylyltransferase [Gelidibacter salicanalis]|uniref:Glucose-1-phosphate thymidylyltransferase n=1 Tax=Gelidibacter salicanalis TaxID=291193 RepID=A0A5C7AQI5_9FLAO|nr:GlmU family protein [Gelidibacter salicanalis]TXE10677.1 glucose-1-phosphate thymidylyltransferase [Gelidibacter salicanalis]
MNYILFDGPFRDHLLPLTYTRPVADLRIGILTIREKWEMYLGTTTTTITEEYLSEKYPMVELDANVLINASYLPTNELVELIKKLEENQAVFKGEDVIAFYASDAQEDIDFNSFEAIEYDGDAITVENTWDIFSKNAEAIQEDYELITEGRTSQPISSTNHILGAHNIFIEEGAVMEFATLNASKGPIYIGKDSEIMEGALIRGPFALCDHSTVKMGTRVYGPTTIGPHCKIGGEVASAVFFAYSNKAHDGYIGNSVIGEWCNIGADTNSSNLKNNYAEVRLWNYTTENFAPTGLQFCGLVMGDHSKCGINSMFNTGTVIGVSANVFGSGYPRNFIPSFSWGGAAGFTTYLTKKAFEVTEVVMSRRQMEFTEQEKDILNHVFELSKKFRRD